jgi:alpha-mannosidase
VKLGSRGILLDTIKLAERSSDFVFRFFETLGMRQTLEIEKGLAMSSETDLLENPRKQKIDAVFGPFKVKTFIGRLEL